MSLTGAATNSVARLTAIAVKRKTFFHFGFFSFRLVRDRFTPRGAYTSRLSKFCSKTSSENLYREGFPAAQQFFHTNLAARRCYWHNNRYTIGWPNPVLSY